MAPKEGSQGRGGGSTQRRIRARIASQACDRCRTRRTKCDEQRPQCGNCQQNNAECKYTETSSARLENVEETVAQVSDSLAELRDKFDTFITNSSPVTAASSQRPWLESDATSSRSSRSAPESSRPQPRRVAQPQPAHQHPSSSSSSSSYENLTVPHRIILWPYVRTMLTASGLDAASDLPYIAQQGTKWFVRREMAKHPRSLPCDVGPSLPSSSTPHEHRRTTFPEMTVGQTKEYTQAYFRTFNVLLPILDYDEFVNVTLVRLSLEGYVDGDLGAIVALLVFALGELAVEAISGEPISVHGGLASGFRGGDLDNPPGLYLFNEARRRLGFIGSLCALENVQINLLQATYYEANAHHLEFWNSIAAASSTIQALIKSQQFEWSTREGDMISRAYWACLFEEDLYHLDLDLPASGIQAFEDQVPLPLFFSMPAPSTSNRLEEERSHFQHHFLAMTALRRLIVRIHITIHDPTNTRAESLDDSGGAPVSLVREMGRQLDSWKSLLPPALQWQDNDRFEFSNATASTARNTTESFAYAESAGHVDFQFNIDILTAQLRTRYYYARYILYRPFVYKALHFPDVMSVTDANNCALAINSMCLWPSLMAPPKTKKRLVPHLYAWTQNFLGMLIIFKTIQGNDCLKRICDEQVNFQRVQETTALMLEWMRDVKQVDGTAEWGWTIVEPLFQIEHR